MKDVILSKSAWHVKFYIWATGSCPYVKWSILCPYFWAILPLLFFSPLILAWKIVKLIYKWIAFIVKSIYKLFPKKVKVKVEKEYVYKKRTPESIRRIEITGNILKWIGRIISGAYILAFVVLVLHGLYELFMAKGALVSFTYIFAVVGAIAVFFAIVWGIMSYFQSGTHTMIVSMIKAKKDKYCPHVTWVD